MGRLLELANQLTGEKVPPVPSLKNHMEPLQTEPLLPVPLAPPVPCEKHEVEKKAHESHPQKRGRPRLTNIELQMEQCEQMNAPANDSLTDDQLQHIIHTAANDHPDLDHAAVDQTQIVDGPQYIIQTAATASLEWIAVRDQHICHLMNCRDCFAPTGRYCAKGADLRQRYDTITEKTAQ